MKRHLDSLHSNKSKVYTKHIKKDGRYKCLLCDHTYSRSSKLKNHYLRKHPQEQLATVGLEEATLKKKR